MVNIILCDFSMQVERAAGYEKVKDEVGKWDNVVKGNRIAEQLIFPLNQPSIKILKTGDFTDKFKVLIQFLRFKQFELYLH